ncbi:F-box domain containing protein [Trema orientale]|uniref:F-box domain containing protein n=1 Tax=Trema orientale TaxID=63057 RepID=A0A2P5ACW7_TREOI|nr:F-box domain containing protein [Trema orientale]
MPLFRKAFMGRRCSDLPEDVLEEIFSWLPPESLVRFKCVSKSWYALINFLIKNLEFVNKHLRNIDKKIFSSTYSVFSCLTDLSHCRNISLLHRDMFKSLTVFHEHDYNKSHHLNYVSEDFRLPTPVCNLYLYAALSSHCNGIICLASGSTLVLCNPATKEVRVLPRPCLSFDDLWVQQVVFGYDSRANDYKIVRLVRKRFIRDQMEYYLKSRAEMYSMGIDSWREINGIPVEIDSFADIGKEVFCNGVFYWPVRARNEFIFSFDLFDEEFNIISLPNNPLVSQRDHVTKLAVWNESLALFLYPAESEVPKSIEVWVMDDCSDHDSKGSCSWINKFVIEPLVGGFATPLTFLKNYKLLMQATDGGLILYDLRSQMLHKLTIVQAVSSIPVWEFSYVKSLVSVQGGSRSISFMK